MIGSNNNSNADLLKAIASLTKAVDGISKTFHDSPRQQRHAAPGARQGAKPGQGNRSPEANERRAQKYADAQYERNKRLARDQEKSFNRITGELFSVSRSIAKMSSLMEKTSKSYKDNLKRHNELLKGVLESDKIGRQFQDNFVTQMSGIMKSNKGMHGQKMTSTTTGGRMKELLEIQENMNSVANKIRAVKKNSGASTVSSMKEGSIRYLMQSLSNAGMTADGMDLKGFEKAMASHDDAIAAKKKAHKIAKASGNGSRAERLGYEISVMEQRKAKMQSDLLKDVGGKIEKTVTGVERFNQSLTRSVIVNTALTSAADFGTNAIRKLGGEGITMASGFKMIGKAMYDYYQYMKSLAGKQMGGAHWDVAAQAMKMGASVSATVDYLKGMMFQVSQLGFDKVGSIIKNNRETFNKLGLFGDDALKAAGQFTQNLMVMGVHPKDEKAFNKAFKAYGERINEMAKLTGASVEELVAQDKAIMSNTESQAMMMRMSQAERVEKMKSILVEKDRIAKMIGSNEEAAKFIQTMQKLNAESPEKRIENAMKIQQMAQMVGMGADGARLSQILMKRDEQLTDEERKFKSDTMMELGKRSKSLQGGGMAQEMIMGKLIDGQTESVKQALQAGADASLSKDQKGSIDENSKEAKEASEKQQISAGQATFQQWTSWLENFMSNPITKLLTGILAGIGVIAASSLMRGRVGQNLMASGKGLLDKFVAGKGAGTAAESVSKAVQGTSKVAGESAVDVGKTLAKDAGKTVAADIAKTAGADVAKTVAKDAGKGIGKSLLKKIPGIGLIAGLGFAASRAMEGDWLGATGELASGAASTIPGLGTAVSVAIDGALLARDISKASDGVTANPAENTASQVKAPSTQELAKAQTPEINNESNDPNTKRKASLEDLLYSVNSGTEAEQDKMDEMIKLLKTLIETVKPENNGLLDAIKSGKGTGISFNDLHDKRTLFATK